MVVGSTPTGITIMSLQQFFFINKKTQDIAKYAWMPEWSKGGDSRSSVIATRRFESCSKYYTHLAQWQSAWLLTWWSQVQSLRWVSKQQIQQNKLEFNLTRGVRIPSVHSARAGKYLLLCKKTFWIQQHLFQLNKKTLQTAIKTKVNKNKINKMLSHS